MKIIAISDTHEQHSQISFPTGDILIHAGDWTYRGSYDKVNDFLQWFSSRPHKYKVFVAGNHELSLDNANRPKILSLIQSFLDKDPNLHYLENSEVMIEGLKFYGSPASPWFHSWAFNYTRGEEIKKIWDKIPLDTNILITHSPPYGILDLAPRDFGQFEHAGCEELRKKIDELRKLKLMCMGHLHLQGSNTETHNDIIFANAAICTEQYKPTNPPIEIDL